MLRTLRSPAPPLPAALALFALLGLAAARMPAPSPGAAVVGTTLRAAPTPPDPRSLLAEAIRTQASRESDETLASAEAVLHANARRIDALAAAGEGRVASRLAAEFDVRPARLRAERARLRLTWGQLAIAHTLAANARPPLPVDALAGARASGTEWSALATALALDLAGCVRAVREEARVAAGLTPPDGRVAPINRVLLN